MIAIYITRPRICEPAVAYQSVWKKSRPPNFIAAETTPINAPPAMKPDASNVPRSRRALLRAASVERVETYQLIKPPTMSGVFKYKGMNIPNAKGNTGTPSKLSNKAKIAPHHRASMEHLDPSSMAR